MDKRLADAMVGIQKNILEGLISSILGLNRRKAIIKTVMLIACTIAFVNPASANLQIVDFFSDFTSSEVTIESSQANHGKAVFELIDGEKVVESKEVSFDAKAGEQISKVILWQNKPQHDYYTARVSLYNDTKLHDKKSYQISYGTVAMPSFHVVDFSPSNKGVQLLLRPFNPSAVDVRIELLDNNDIVYSETKEDVSLTANTELMMDWPFLLSNNKKYTARAKIFTHRLYSEPLINTYIADFTASDDVEILHDDVEVDEYGTSVTLRGKSQVPFDGSIEVTARSRATNETQTYRQQIEEILVSGKEDTAGVVWKGLAPGTYDVEIKVVNKENIELDRYETVLRIPEVAKESETPTVNNTPSSAGYTGLFAAVIVIIVLVAVMKKRGD